MIYIEDNFLDEFTFENTLEHLEDNEFKKVTAGEKDFWCQFSNDDFDDYVISKIETLENKNIKNIFSFFRVSTNEIDNDWRIHADTIIMGEKPNRAIVLYLSDSFKKDLHGTAFWEHTEMGETMPVDISDEEFDKILLRDSNDLDKWNLKSVVGYRPNRLISYPCNYFHSKYPNESWNEGRVVYVMFYAVD